MHCYLVPIDTSTNWTHLYRALLHQDSITYDRMQWYLVQIDPPHSAHLYRALLHENSITYWEMHIYQRQMEPPCSPSVQYPTTPKQYYLLRNADIPRAARHPHPCKLNPSLQSPTTPIHYDMAECRLTQCQCIP